jgi:hypothetical protein
MKSKKIIYCATTGLIVAFDGLLPALTFNTTLAKEGIAHLGYPDYFRVVLTVFKVLGAILLIFPQVSRRVKEWAYAGFTFNFVCAAISHGVVDGPADFQTWMPLIILAILGISYFSLNRLAQSDRKHSVPIFIG